MSKINTVLRVGLILSLVAIAILILAISTTFAKYLSTGSGTDDARVAKWGISMPIDEDLKLFSSEYQNDKKETIVRSEDGTTRVVAPGTAQTSTLTVVMLNGGPEVLYNFEANLTCDQVQDKTILALDSDPAFVWTMQIDDGTTLSFQTFAKLQEAFDGLSQANVAPNTKPDCFKSIAGDRNKVTLGWIWEFDDATHTHDTSDTNLGNLTAQGLLDDFTVHVNFVAEQSQSKFYNVTFHANNIGTTPPTQTVVEGKCAVDPKWDGPDDYEFLGWYTDEACTTGNEFDFNTPITKDTDLYAKWNKLKDYTVKIDTNEEIIGKEGSFSRPLTVTTETAVDLNVAWESSDEAIAEAKITPNTEANANQAIIDKDYEAQQKEDDGVDKAYGDTNSSSKHYNVQIITKKAGKCYIDIIVNLPKDAGYKKITKRIPVDVREEAVPRDVSVSLETSTMEATKTITASANFVGDYTDIVWNASDPDIVSLTPSADKKTCTILANRYSESPITITAKVIGKGYLDSEGSAQINKIDRAENIVELAPEEVNDFTIDSVVELSVSSNFGDTTTQWTIEDADPSDVVSLSASTGKATNLTALKEGSCKIKAYIPQTDVYAAGEATISINTQKNLLSPEWGNTEWNYDAQDHHTTCTFNNIKAGDSVTAVLNNNNIHNVGTQTVELVGLEGDQAYKYKIPEGITQDITITPRLAELVWDTQVSFEYDGEAHCPGAVVSNKQGDDTCDVEVEVEGGEAVNVGNYVAIAKSLSNENYILPDQVTQNFKITSLVVAAPKALNPTYTGSEIDGVGPTDDKYELSDYQATDAGTDYKATAHLKNSNYTWDTTGKNDDIEIAFVINPKQITDTSIEIIQKSGDLTFNGEEQEMQIQIKDNDRGVILGDDEYEIQSGNKATNVSENDLTIVVKGKGNYSATNSSFTWNIKPKDITNDTNIVIEANDYTYNASAHTVEFTVTDKAIRDGVVLVKGKDFIATGDLDKTDAGDYEFNIEGSGNYTGNKTQGWKIFQAEMTISIVGAQVTDKYNPEAPHIVEAKGYTAESSIPELFNLGKLSPKSDECSVSSSNRGKTMMGLPDKEWSYDDSNIIASFDIVDGYVCLNQTSLVVSVVGDVNTAKIKNTISYAFSVYNDGDTAINNVVVSDPLADDFDDVTIETLNPKETVNFVASHVVASKDFTSTNTFTNVVTATFIDGDVEASVNGSFSTSLQLTDVSIPDIEGKQVSYIGEKQTVLGTTEEYKVSEDGSATDVKDGGYYCTAALYAGYRWSDATIENKRFHWEILPVALTVTAYDNQITYGEAPAASPQGVKANGLVGKDVGHLDLLGTISYDFSYSIYGDIGDAYTITPKGITSSNYTVSYVAGKLTVVALPVTIVWDKLSQTFTNSPLNATASVGNLAKADDNVTVTVTRTGDGINVADYAVEATALSNNNYTLVGGSQLTETLHITPADRTNVSLTVPSENLFVKYNGSVVTGSVSTTVTDMGGASNHYSYQSNNTGILTASTTDSATCTATPVAGGITTIKATVTDSNGNYNPYEVTSGNITVNNFTYEAAAANGNEAVASYVAKTPTSSITFPNTVTKGGATSNITQIGDGTNPVLTTTNTTTNDVKFSTNNAVIAYKAFYQYKTLKTVAFTASITSMGPHCFRETNIETADMSKSTKLTTLANSSFQSCTALGTVVVPSNVTNLGDSTFNGCSKLTAITINSSGITSIKANVFSGSGALTSTVTGPVYDSTGKYLLGTTSKYSQECVYIKSTCLTIADSAFSSRTALRKFVTENKSLNVGASAFYKCTGLENFVVRASSSGSGEVDSVKYNGGADSTVFEGAGHSNGTSGSELIFASVKNSSYNTYKVASALSKKFFQYYGAEGSINPPNSADMSYYRYVKNDITLSSAASITGKYDQALDLNGHSVTRGLTSSTKIENGYVIKVNFSSGDQIYRIDNTANINTTDNSAGKITGGYNTIDTGGGLYITKGIVHLRNGNIYKNYATEGGGVALSQKTDTDTTKKSMYMYGGVISSNKSTTTTSSYGGGGAIDVKCGAYFQIYRGTITNNSAKYGGGVYVIANGTAKGSMRVSGGSITGNSATGGYGEGIFLRGLSSSNKVFLEVTGGTVQSVNKPKTATYVEYKQSGGTVSKVTSFDPS